MGYDGAEVSIVLTDDREIAKLNKRYRNKQGPTDVLSFAMNEGEAPQADRALLGDVVISVERAELQAADFGVPVAHEMLRLLIHGLLHLCGYDHENVSAYRARIMRRKEQEFFRELVRTIG